MADNPSDRTTEGERRPRRRTEPLKSLKRKRQQDTGMAGPGEVSADPGAESGLHATLSWTEDCLAGEGDTGAMMRSADGSQMSLGPVEATYEPTELAACTAELADAFRPAIEKAGLELLVDCPTLPEPVYVDREMWEKIVLNLLSNALKSTFEGRIIVRLRWMQDHVELAVRDTGTGIPQRELPRLFERFHRVPNARTRSHQGTGTGLTLVRELVKLHGGRISVKSTVGKGSLFTISIPTGSAHLPKDRISTAGTSSSGATTAALYLEEALRWLADDDADRNATEPVGDIPDSIQGDSVGVTINSITNGYYALDAEWRFVAANRRAEEHFRRPAHELLGQNIWQMTGVSDDSILYQRFRQAMVERRPVHFEAQSRIHPGFWAEMHLYPRNGILDVYFSDISERKQAEEKIRQQNAVLEAINRVFREALTCETEEELANACLAAAEEVTLSKFGFIGQINSEGRLDDLVISDPRRIACRMADKTGHCTLPADLAVHGIYGRVLLDGKGFLTNDPASHPDSIGTPGGHPPLTAFLGVPLVQDGKTIGMVGLGNREGGYRSEDLAALEALAPAIVQAFMRKRTEQALRESECRARERLAEIEAIYNSAPIGLCVLDRELRYVRINERLAEIKGAPAQEHIGRTVREVVPSLADAAEELARRVFRTGEPVLNVELTGVTQAQPGVERSWIEHWLPLKDERGEVVGINVAAEEITEQKRIRTALLDSERRLRATFENVAVGIALLDLGRRFVRVNDRFCAITGYSRDELMTRTVRDIIHPDDMEADAAQARRVCAGEIDHYSMEKRYCRKDGTIIWVSITVSMQQDEAGEPRYFIGVAQDISRRKAAEDALRESEQRLRLVLEGARMGRWEWDLQDDGGVWCERMYELLGLDGAVPARMKTFFDLVHPGDRLALEESVQETLAGSDSLHAEFRVVRPNGQIMWLASRGRVVRGGQGRPIRMFGVLYDVTEQRQLDEELRQLNERLEEQVVQRTEELMDTIDRLQDEVARRVLAEGKLRKRSQMLEAFFQHTVTPVAFLDRYFNFVRVNKAYARAAGKDPEFFRGKSHFVVHPYEETRAIFEQVMQTRRPYRAYARPSPRSGDSRQDQTWWNWHVMPLLDGVGDVQFLVFNLEDVTEQQVALRELEQRARQLQKLTLELSQAEDRERKHLAEILHDDLQQVLAAAKFHLGLLMGRAREDEGMCEVAGHLNRLLKDAIDKSRGLSHELSPAVLYQSDLGETFEWLAGQLQAKHGLVVHVEVRGRVDSSSEALKAILYKAAQEMLFNVVKHARVREARLRLQRMQDELWLTISDKGRGFDPALSGRTTGFGLLSIRERIEFLGGRMRIRSAPGKGSTFVITVPDAASAATLPADSLAAPGPGGPRKRGGGQRLRVLLADDHKVVREGLAVLLNEESDIEVVGQAANGREAVDLAHRLEPDVVIMDVSMPVMAGDEATRQIKLHLPATRIVALSMFEEVGITERMRRAGADGYLLKTAPAEALFAAIRGGQPPPEHS